MPCKVLLLHLVSTAPCFTCMNITQCLKSISTLYLFILFFKHTANKDADGSYLPSKTKESGIDHYFVKCIGLSSILKCCWINPSKLVYFNNMSQWFPFRDFYRLSCCETELYNYIFSCKKLLIPNNTLQTAAFSEWHNPRPRINSRCIIFLLRILPKR